MAHPTYNRVPNPSTFNRLGSKSMNSPQTLCSTKRAIGLAVTLALGLSAYGGTANAVTADNVICSGCVGTSDLAANAVTGAKIQNNTITGDDVASETLDRNDIKDEPGIDTPFFNGTHSGMGALHALDGNYWLVQQQITITHPAPGWVHCTAQGTMRWYNNANPWAHLGWSDSPSNSVAPEGYAVGNPGVPNALQPISTMRSFLVVGSGSKTFYLKAKKVDIGAAGSVNYYRQGAACTYFPTQY
ncbi:exported hypothetical protein [Thiocapsa sp. KS1]|jgi:hypothetical protein|nr:hypothetical protein [Thiocapsa sp. KS1]CRI63289.1 exported hypothetical protein [Thiocapsa sp. KS1]